MPRSNRLAARIAVLLLALVTLGGCGAGSSSNSPVSLTAPAGGAVVGDMANGCWTPDQVEGQGEAMAANQYSAPPAMMLEEGKTYTVSVETNYGTMEFSFYPEDAPITVNNFVCLAKDGYYDNTIFHRIIAGFVIQGGDPTGTGAGGPGYRFADEPVKKDYLKGTLAMANAGPNTNGSQFFIVLDNLTGKLPKNYTIFGQVTAGLDVVDAIAGVPVQRSRSGESSSPVAPVQLIKATLTVK
jgi:cyclophilin family peptidyl-prolyl cis-trans isomerase